MQLEACDTGFRYGEGSWVMRGVQLTLSEGEVVGLTGPSGCGKTTLMRILAGYLKPCEGRVGLDGINGFGVGYNPVQLVFQHPEKAVNPRWRMRETLSEGGMPEDHFLSSLGIEKEWLNRWPNELSGGELQRFCVARALGPGTRFLIADEMTTMLDAITQAQIWQVVMEIAKKRNLGVLVVSHDPGLIKRLCDRVVDLEKMMKASSSKLDFLV